MITPRAHEKRAVAEIIDSTAFEDSTGMAEAVIKRVAQLVQERDGREGTGLFMVVLEGAPVGPFYTEGDAQRWKDEAYETLRLRGRVTRLMAPTTWTVVEKHENRGAGCSCGHAKEQHRIKKKGQNLQSAECGVFDRRARQWCSCPVYVRAVP